MEGQYEVIRPLSASIDVYFHTNILKENYVNITFGIMPNNRMEGQYEVFPRPKIKKKLTPIRDAFVKEDVPTYNYGGRTQLRVGVDEHGNRHRSFLLFNIDEVDRSLNIISAKLKLTTVYQNYSSDMFELSTSNRKFDEYGVTWANQPTRDQFLDIVETLPNQEKIEIDITDTFIGWYADKRENNGIVLKEFENTYGKEIAFYSRESGQESPILEIEYFDPGFYIPFRHQIDMNFDVWKQVDKNLPINFEVESFYRQDEIPIDLFVLSVIGELYMDFTISQTVLPLEFTVRQKSDIDIDFNIIHDRFDDSMLVDFTTSQTGVPLDFNVEGMSYRWVDFIIHHPTLPVDFVVTQDSMPISMNILFTDNIDLNFTVTQDTMPIEFEYRYISDMPVLFHITKDIHKPEDDIPIAFSYSYGSIPIDFTVAKYSDLPMSLNINAVDDRDIEFVVLKSFSDNKDLDFIVRAIEDLDLDFEIASRFLGLDFHVIKVKQSFKRLDFNVNAVDDMDIDFIVAQKNDIIMNFHIQKQLFNDIDILFVVDGKIKKTRAYVFIM